MNNLKFTHQILVPNNAARVSSADSYCEELEDVTIYHFTQEEYNLLRRSGGLFDIFDRNFGTIIDDCEEDRIMKEDIADALTCTGRFASRLSDSAELKAVGRVRDALLKAFQNGVFCEFVNGLE